MMSVAYKEGLSFPPAGLNKVIVAANQDVRQVWLYGYSRVTGNQTMLPFFILTGLAGDMPYVSEWSFVYVLDDILPKH